MPDGRKAAPRKRPRSANKPRQSRTEEIKKVVQEELNTLRKIIEAMLRKLKH